MGSKMRQISISRMRCSRAFTVLEISVGILIASLFYMTFVPATLSMIETAKSTTTNEEIKEFSEKIDSFLKDNGRLPDTLEEVFGEVPLDPWGNPYQYTNIVKAKGKGKLRKDKNLVPINTDYDFYSMGPDGESASPLTAAISQDDIVRGRNGAFFGVASEY